MANSVSAPYYGPYPTNMQAGYSTSPTGTLGVPGSIPGSGPAYSSYDNTKQFSGAAMLAASFASPTAPQYSAAAAYYSQPNTSITYGQHTTSGIYSNYNNQSQLQANTSLTAAHAQLAAASLRGFQSPPYGTTSFSSLQHTGAASVQPSFDQTLYNKMYSEQIAAAQVQAAQQQAQQQQAQQQQALQQAHQQQQQQQAEVQQVQAQLSSGFQQKHDIVDGYIQAGGANRLQASIIPQPTQHHLLSSKQQLSAHITPTSPSPDHRSSYPNLDSLQSSFSCPPPVVPPPTSLPPKPTPHMPPTNKMSSLSMRENRNKHSDVSPGSQHMFKRSVVTCKIPFQKTIHMHNHLCETCKVSCASSKTYKDHIEGQRHKKRVALREQEKKNEEQAAAPPTGPSYKCVLCDVTCTGKETFDAHITGMKHKKAAKLYKELGKEIPPHEITGDTEPKPEVPVVGRELIETKSDASKSSKVIYHCKMCECTFNDDLAKELHLKGRRHRLNYKKNYDPSLKVEIQPSKREKIAEQKARRRAEEAERRRNMVESRRHIWEQSRWRAEEEWHEWAEARSWHQYESLKQKQAADYEERVTKEKEHCKKMGLPEPTLPPRPHIPPPPPRQNNARFICPGIDEFLMIQKQSMVSPKEEHLDTLQDLVSGVEMALRQVSDNLYSETKEQMSAQGITPTITARIIRTIHKTGDLTKAILLHENLTTDVAVLCTEKPTQSILTTVYSKFKDLFQCPEEGKVELRADKSMFVVTQGDGAPDFVVNVKLTSPAFDAPVSEDERRAEFVAKVLERKFCEIAMSDVNEAGWYKSRFKPNTPAVIVLRILASLRLEPDSELKDLSIQALQMLVFIAFKTFGHIKTVAPTLILRRFFELLAAGYILTEELIPHWHQAKTPTKNLLENLEMQQREKITEYAQYALRCIALGQLHKVLLIPPPPNPPAFPSPIPSARS